METASVKSEGCVEQVNPTSAMDIDSPSDVTNSHSESDDKETKCDSLKPGACSVSDSPNVPTAGDRNKSLSLTSDRATATRDCLTSVNDSTAVSDSISPVNDHATAVSGSVRPICDGASAVGDGVSPVNGGATSLEIGAAASGHSASASACDTSAAEVAETIKSHGANPVLLSQLLEMGVPANLAIRALLFSGNSSVEGAFTWLAELSAEEADALSLRPVEDDAHDWEDVDDDDETDAFSHKMALVVDTSLRMKPGKTAAQVGHAVLGLYRILQRAAPRQRASALSKWEITGEKMVVLRASDTNQLRLLKRKADAVRLSSYMVADAGLTQIAPGSVTVLAIFGASREVDVITGDLKLL